MFSVVMGAFHFPAGGGGAVELIFSLFTATKGRDNSRDVLLRTGTKAVDSKAPFKSVLSNKRGSVAEDDTVDGRAAAPPGNNTTTGCKIPPPCLFLRKSSRSHRRQACCLCQ